MKRCSVILLALSLFLSGCGILGERIKEPVTFYYLQSEFQYGSKGNIVVPEEREASGHRNDLLYLMKLYLMGPAGEELRSPLPRGTQILSAKQKDDHITISVSDTAKTLSDVEFSLACACLSMTCLDMTEAENVTIISGERSITLSYDSLMLYDAIPSSTEENT